MPVLIRAEAAASEIVKGLRAGKFEIDFPRRFTNTMTFCECFLTAGVSRYPQVGGTVDRDAFAVCNATEL